MPDEEKKEVEYLLQVSVTATDLKDACNKITGGSIVAGGPMPKATVSAPPRPPLAPVQNQPTK